MLTIHAGGGASFCRVKNVLRHWTCDLQRQFLNWKKESRLRPLISQLFVGGVILYKECLFVVCFLNDMLVFYIYFYYCVIFFFFLAVC